MVYCRNICSLHEKMEENELLKIGFRSGKSVTIKYNDKMHIASGDVCITRYTKAGRCITYLDPAEVECISLITIGEI